MADKQLAPIIIVKKKINAAAHHGGAWKVAYADFVTAMMAFFMVMWLSATMPQEQLGGIAEYFKNPSILDGRAAAMAPGAMGPGGAGTAPVAIFQNNPPSPPETGDGPRPESAEGAGPMSEEQIEAEAREIEKRRLENLMDELQDAIETSASLSAFKEQLLLDITPEGLRIQIVDQRNRPMFDVGSFRLQSYTIGIINELAPYLDSVPNRISITGHTDVTPFGGGDTGYTNWELSADRANAARRALINGGLDAAKIARVVGVSSTVLFNQTEPTDPINRRISIIVMNKKAEDAARSDGEAVKADAASPEASAPESADEGQAPPGLPPGTPAALLR